MMDPAGIPSTPDETRFDLVRGVFDVNASGSVVIDGVIVELGSLSRSHLVGFVVMLISLRVSSVLMGCGFALLVIMSLLPPCPITLPIQLVVSLVTLFKVDIPPFVVHGCMPKCNCVGMALSVVGSVSPAMSEPILSYRLTLVHMTTA